MRPTRYEPTPEGSQRGGRRLELDPRYGSLEKTSALSMDRFGFGDIMHLMSPMGAGITNESGISTPGYLPIEASQSVKLGGCHKINVRDAPNASVREAIADT